MKEKNILLILPVLILFLSISGCEPSDPGSLIGNQPPQTQITVAPVEGDTTDHYQSPSSMFHIQWFGHDTDGYVTGYWVQVDDGPEAWTTKGDSSIAFESSTPDPDNDGQTLPTAHTIRVAAQDNEGLRDPTPDERTFSTINSIPQISAFVSNFADGATVGQGIAFEIEPEDVNPSGILLRVLVDGEPVTDWDNRTSFQFMAVEDTALLETVGDDIYTIDKAELVPSVPGDPTNDGVHELSVEIKDLGGAMGDAYTRTITVSDTFVPVLQTIESTYGATAYYPDGSIFHRPRTTTNFTMIGDASFYAGQIHSYRYRARTQDIPATPADSSWSDWSDWSDWGTAEFSMDALEVGEYQFEAQNRDWAGVKSPISNYVLTIINPDLNNKNLLIIDETKNGNGRPGSPDDEQQDAFYRDILGVDTTSMTTESGWSVKEIDYKTHRINDASYISAKDVYNQRIVIWHTDDKSSFSLGDNIRVLSEYLDEGGRLILVGWNILSPFTADDTASFTSGFVHRYLRIEGGLRDPDNNFIEFNGNTDMGYPESVNIDMEKISARWGGIGPTWTFTPRHRTESIGIWHGKEGSTEPMEGGIAIVRNFNDVNPWRTIVIGFPLYFTVNAEASALMNQALEDIDG